MTDKIAELAQKYSQLWDECVIAENARYEEGCYGDLPKDRGPHILGRSEKGLEADRLEIELRSEKAAVAKALRALIERQAGIDTWKLRCLFV